MGSERTGNVCIRQREGKGEWSRGQGCKGLLLHLKSSSAVTLCVLFVHFKGFLSLLESIGHSLLQAFVPLELFILAVDDGFAVPEGRFVDLGLKHRVIDHRLWCASVYGIVEQLAALGQPCIALLNRQSLRARLTALLRGVPALELQPAQFPLHLHQFLV